MLDPLPDGGAIRKLWIVETDDYRDHLLRLDNASRYDRFVGAMSDERISEHVRTAIGPGAVVHGFFVEGVLRGVSELRLMGFGRAHEAEVAFSVEKSWQSLGVGSALLERTLLAARNRGVHSLQMVCLSDNRRMQQLARKFEAELRFRSGGVVGEVEAARPTPLSLIREFLADGHGVANTLLDAQSRLLRPQ